MIKKALKWLLKNKKYRDIGNERSATYSTTWIKFLNRCKDYPNQQLLRKWIDRNDFDQEIKAKILEVLDELDNEPLDYKEVLKVLDGKLDR